MTRSRSPKAAKAALLMAAVALLLHRCTTFIAPTRCLTGDKRGIFGQNSRREFLGAAGAAVVQAGAPLAANAAIARWSGAYDDPKHPGCERSITKDRDDFVISGTSSTDGNKACLEDAPTKKWFLIAQQGHRACRGNGPRLEVGDTEDFSPKGGPKDAVAKFDGDGIVFPDGNRWSKIKRKPGAAAASYLDGPASPLKQFSKGKVPQ
eukprot:Skav201010  [mRNA]  locus=scaffold991:302198:308228:- [translate_table: standard]